MRGREGALMEGEEGQRRGGSIEGQASARGRGEEEEGGGGRWQIFWLASMAVALGTKARYCHVCQPKYLLVHKTSYSACPKNTLLVKDYT